MLKSHPRLHHAAYPLVEVRVLVRGVGVAGGGGVSRSRVDSCKNMITSKQAAGYNNTAWGNASIVRSSSCVVLLHHCRTPSAVDCCSSGVHAQRTSYYCGDLSPSFGRGFVILPHYTSNTQATRCSSGRIHVQSIRRASGALFETRQKMPGRTPSNERRHQHTTNGQGGFRVGVDIQAAGTRRPQNTFPTSIRYRHQILDLLALEYQTNKALYSLPNKFANKITKKATARPRDQSKRSKHKRHVSHMLHMLEALTKTRAIST